MILKIGLIGCSKVAEKNFFSYIQNSSNYQLHIIGSRSLQKAKEWADKFGSPKYGDYDDVLNSDIDVVYITLPISLHEEWSIKAANKGLHIICEKSLTTSYPSAKRMVEASQKNNVRLLEAFSFRFHPQHNKILQLINEATTNIYNFHGYYGMPSFPKNDIRWNKSLGGGVLNDVACYPVCASRILLQGEPKTISSHMVIDEETGVDIKVDILATFEDGKTAFISCGFDHYYQSKYSVWGDSFKISCERAYAVPRNFETTIIRDQEDQLTEYTLEPIDQFAQMFDYFFNALQGQELASFKMEDDLLNQSIYMEAIRISSSENNIVHLDDIPMQV